MTYPAHCLVVLDLRCCYSGSAPLLDSGLEEFSAEVLAFLHGLSSFCLLSLQWPLYWEKYQLKAEVCEVT